MNLLDGLLLVGGAAAILVGWRLGLVCGVSSLLAILTGGAAGFLVGGVLAGRLAIDALEESLVVMAATVVGIAIGQFLVTGPSQRLHDAVSATRLSAVNKAGGAVFGLGFAIAIVWMLATALALAPATGLATLMRGSTVLVRLDSAVPGDAGPLLQQLEAASGRSEGARVFTGMGLLPAPPVDLPDPAAVSGTARSGAQASVVRIMGHTVCGKTLAGSGVVVAEDLVMTNAHVVAGVPSPYAFPDGRRIGAAGTLVFFDPATDLALLRVPNLGLPPVRLSKQVQTGDLVAVAGYPNGGELDVKAGRIRGPIIATGTDIYGHSSVQREVLVVAADVIPGDSGGALLSSEGEMVGVIFAAAIDATGHTAYALSAGEAERAIAVAGSTEAVAVSAGQCVPEPEHTGE